MKEPLILTLHSSVALGCIPFKKVKAVIGRCSEFRVSMVVWVEAIGQATVNSAAKVIRACLIAWVCMLL